MLFGVDRLPRQHSFDRRAVTPTKRKSSKDDPIRPSSFSWSFSSDLLPPFQLVEQIAAGGNPNLRFVKHPRSCDVTPAEKSLVMTRFGLSGVVDEASGIVCSS
jgi:hypothetical protein